MDRLFDDRWAAAVIAQLTHQALDAHGLPPMGSATDDGDSQLWDNWGSYFVVRTPFYDAHVQSAVAHGAEQVVLLAAGFDGRAGRLKLPAGTTVFELDTPEVLGFKGTALRNTGVGEIDEHVVRRTVPVDLRADWPVALLAAGFDPARRTVWVAEGLLMYLDAEQCDRLLERVTALSAPRSRLATEWFERNPAGEKSMVDYPREADRRTGRMVGSLFRSGPSKAPDMWLQDHGWDALETDDVGARYSRHGRSGPWIFDTQHPDGLRVLLVAGEVTNSVR